MTEVMVLPDLKSITTLCPGMTSPKGYNPLCGWPFDIVSERGERSVPLWFSLKYVE